MWTARPSVFVFTFWMRQRTPYVDSSSVCVCIHFLNQTENALCGQLVRLCLYSLFESDRERLMWTARPSVFVFTFWIRQRTPYVDNSSVCVCPRISDQIFCRIFTETRMGVLFRKLEFRASQFTGIHTLRRGLNEFIAYFNHFMSRFGRIRYRTFTVYSLLPGTSTILPTCSAFFRPGTSSTQLHSAMWVSLESSHGRRHWLLLRETEWHLQSIVMSRHVVHTFTILLLTG
jgi:hypothetical protein